MIYRIPENILDGINIFLLGVTGKPRWELSEISGKLVMLDHGKREAWPLEHKGE